MTFVTTVIGFWSDAVLPLAQWLRSKPIQAPRLTIAAMPMEAPTTAAISATEFQALRSQIIEIQNINDKPIENIRLSLQYPEPILQMSVQDLVVRSGFSALPNWDKMPMTVSGAVSPNLITEPYGLSELTGLWQCSLESIPAASGVRIQVVTSNAKDGEVYYSEARKCEAMRSGDELLWMVHGTFEVNLAGDRLTKSVLVPLVYDQKHRTVRAQDSTDEPLGSVSHMSLRHGKGIRAIGIFRTTGYFMASGSSGTIYTAPVMMERLDGVEAKFGLFGSPATNPGFVLNIGHAKP